jgi:hypothetical protein
MCVQGVAALALEYPLEAKVAHDTARVPARFAESAAHALDAVEILRGDECVCVCVNTYAGHSGITDVIAGLAIRPIRVIFALVSCNGGHLLIGELAQVGFHCVARFLLMRKLLHTVINHELFKFTLHSGYLWLAEWLKQTVNILFNAIHNYNERERVTRVTQNRRRSTTFQRKSRKISFSAELSPPHFTNMSDDEREEGEYDLEEEQMVLRHEAKEAEERKRKAEESTMTRRAPTRMVYKNEDEDDENAEDLEEDSTWSSDEEEEE